MFVISRCFNWQDIHSIPKIGLRDVLTLFLVACDWRLGQQYCVPQDSQMQFDVGSGSSSTSLLLGTPSILIVYKISGKILTPPVSPISSQSLNLFVSSTIPSQGCGSFKGNIYLCEKSFRIAICIIPYSFNIAHFCTCEIEEGIVVGKHSSYGSVHRIAVSSEEARCCLCCMAFCIIPPINPWNLH